MSFFSRSSSILGVDIGTAYIKAVQLKQDADQPILESYGLVNVSYPTETAEELDPVVQVAQILKALHEKARFTTKQVIVSLPSNVAFVSILEMPPLSEKELPRSVEYQARKYVPLPLADVSLGWQILEDARELKVPEGVKHEGKIKVLLTAVPNNVLANYRRLFELAGLEIKAVEIESLSVIRSLLSQGNEEGVLIVDIGAKSTILSLIFGQYLWSTYYVSAGSDTVTSSIAKSLGVSFERAEAFKRETMDSDLNSPVIAITRTVTDLIKSQIQQLILISENQGKKISKLILTGGGSQIPGIDKEFLSVFPVVEFGNCLGRVSYAPALEGRIGQVAPQLSVAVGLALRT